MIQERRLQEQISLSSERSEQNAKAQSREQAQNMLTNLVPSVFSTLSQHGYFYDQVEKEVKNTFLPWLCNQVDSELEAIQLARNLLDGII